MLVHFSLFFGKATPSLHNRFGFTMTSIHKNEMRQEKQQRRSGIWVVGKNELPNRVSFFVQVFCPFVTPENTTHRYEHSNDTSVTKTQGFASLIPLGLYEYI